MSAAANAAGYLFAHRQLPMPDRNAQADAERPQARPEPIKHPAAPKIEYRKRRAYALPSAA